MDKFLALPEEKRRTILDGAMRVFGEDGYKKAYVSEIAAAAGISKAMVFYYFGTKKALYLYLVECAFSELRSIFGQYYDYENRDFFERVLSAAKIKVSFLAEHPSLVKFTTSAVFEKDEEVNSELQEFLRQTEAFRRELVLNDIDLQKFKETVDPQLVLNMLTKYSMGYADGRPMDGTFDWKGMMQEFSDTLQMLKNNFYKEDYLK